MSRMHYANFYAIFLEDLNRVDAQHFIENAVSNMTSCKRGDMYPTGPSYKLNGREKKSKILLFLILEYDQM